MFAKIKEKLSGVGTVLADNGSDTTDELKLKAEINEVFADGKLVALRSVQLNRVLSGCTNCWGYERIFMSSGKIAPHPKQLFWIGNPDSLTHPNKKWSTFRVKRFADGTIGFQFASPDPAYNGNYITGSWADHNVKNMVPVPWGTRPLAMANESASTSKISWAKFKPVKTPDGYWALYNIAYKGYLVPCYCNTKDSPNIDYGATLHGQADHLRTWARIEVLDIDMASCCKGINTPRSSAAICGQYWNNPASCDPYMNAFCRDHPENPHCTCINSPIKKYSPRCVDAKCVQSGYLTSNMRIGQCPSIVDCSTQILLEEAGRDMNVSDINVEQNCKGELNTTTTTTTTTPPPTTPRPPAPLPGPTVDTAGGAADDANAGDAADSNDTNTTMIILMFVGFVLLILAALGVVYMRGRGQQSYPQSYQQSYPQYSQYPQYPQQQYAAQY